MSKLKRLSTLLNLIAISLLAITPPMQAQDTGLAQPQEVTNSLDMKLIRIAAGRFTMGSSVDEPHSRPDETLHKVEISKDYYLGAFEVTEKIYAQVMEIKPRERIQYNENRRPIGTILIEFTDLPVNAVSWYDAREFCQRLSQLPEEKKAKRRYRLPTEAEWEYACRAGSQTAYCYGDNPRQLGDYAWYNENTRGQRGSKVNRGGLKRPNAWGLYDMHGNVVEWCRDIYGDYPEGFVVDPVGPERGIMAVARGGGWLTNFVHCRSAARMKRYPDDGAGFRVVMVPITEAEEEEAKAEGVASEDVDGSR